MMVSAIVWHDTCASVWFMTAMMTMFTSPVPNMLNAHPKVRELKARYFESKDDYAETIASASKIQVIIVLFPIPCNLTPVSCTPGPSCAHHQPYDHSDDVWHCCAELAAPSTTSVLATAQRGGFAGQAQVGGVLWSAPCIRCPVRHSEFLLNGLMYISSVCRFLWGSHCLLSAPGQFSSHCFCL